DPGLALGGVRGVLEREVGQSLQRLDANQGGIEVEDEDGRDHARPLAPLRIRSNKKGRRSAPFRTIFPVKPRNRLSGRCFQRDDGFPEPRPRWRRRWWPRPEGRLLPWRDRERSLRRP